MAKYKVFTVYDSKAKAYMQPFFQNSVGEALRAWDTSVNDSQTMFNKYPADFTLFQIAEYDDEIGQYNNLEVKTNLGNGLEVIQASKNMPVQMQNNGPTLLSAEQKSS